MYVPLMAEQWAERLKKDDLTQSKQYIKLNSLYDLLNGKNRRLGYLLITEMVCVYSQLHAAAAPDVYQPHVVSDQLFLPHFSGYLCQHWECERVLVKIFKQPTTG